MASIFTKIISGEIPSYKVHENEKLVFSKEVARKIEAVIECERIGVSVIGLEVPHAHVHLIPMNSVSDMNFAKPKLELDSDYMADLAEKIRQA